MGDIYIHTSGCKIPLFLRHSSRKPSLWLTLQWQSHYPTTMTIRTNTSNKKLFFTSVRLLVLNQDHKEALTYLQQTLEGELDNRDFPGPCKADANQQCFLPSPF